jgi:hypothetical protein
MYVSWYLLSRKWQKIEQKWFFCFCLPCSQSDKTKFFFFCCGNANEKTTFDLIFVLWGECLAGPLDEAGWGLAELAGHAVDRGDNQVIQRLQTGSRPWNKRRLSISSLPSVWLAHANSMSVNNLSLVPTIAVRKSLKKSGYLLFGYVNEL